MPPIKNRPNCALERRGLRRIRDYTLRSVVVADESPSNDIEPTELYALERRGLRRIRDYTLRSVVVADEGPSNDIELTELYALERCGLRRIRGYTLRSVVVADESPSNGQIEPTGYTRWSVVVTTDQWGLALRSVVVAKENSQTESNRTDRIYASERHDGYI
ncbi:uncharacterized protein BDCG_07030 [Blastomyces dermatitidis ER-3]|uniref:Uncharacterized protein n=1 Tax=Ajellomyces dermatitidis (strain ER-3 / ATCC MYA-2586) TaxID=559297 RepID=A0ABP2F615_AJEDR|nr:uncharacterized protein BDCG_07030 [Blastomyces dermatitidis ER-3]EEQ91910.2 hypothetical protein BDCG_07030 [Blastomyces dermatitidis ER-3]